MKEEAAKKIIFQAAIDLTRGVLSNPASAAIINDSYRMSSVVETSVNVAKEHFDRLGIKVECD